jgi:hypothetical protein
MNDESKTKKVGEISSKGLGELTTQDHDFYTKKGYVVYENDLLGGRFKAQVKHTRGKVEWKDGKNSITLEADRKGNASLKYNRSF